MRPALSATIVALAALLVAACATPANRQGGQGGQGGAETAAPSEVWRSDGYGWIVAISGNRAQTYETTSISCLPGRALDQLGQPSTDGTVQYGRKGIAAQTLRRGTEGRATLHLLGTAADVDLLPLPGLPAACTRPMPDDPLTTFDVFWATFAENYNSFARKNIDWAAARARFRPKVTAETDSDELYAVLRDMIKPLEDMHTAVTGADGEEFSGQRLGTRDLSSRDLRTAVDDHLREDLGVAEVQNFAGNAISYADLPGGRGYLRVNAFEGYREDDGSYLASKAELDRVLDAVFTPARVAALRGLVIDLRNNSGGDDALGLQLAGRLTATPYPAFGKQPRNDPKDQTRHGRLRTVTVTPADGPRYTGPVRLLTSELTISAAETFVMAMLARTPAPSRVGTATQGVFADDMTRKLPNGWTCTLGNEEYFAPDGRSFEGAGIPPTVTIPVFTESELEQHRDAALDAPW
jgi:hypothetical protein